MLIVPPKMDSSSPSSDNSGAKATSKSHFRIERPRSAAEALDPRLNRPLNRFNLYYIIERERLLQSLDGYQPDEADGPLPPDIVTGYEGLQLPELPKKYRHIEIAEDWFVPGKRKMIKRNHKKSHGLMSFGDIARHTAETWKTVDDETFAFVTEVARLIMVRFKEIEAALGGALTKSHSSKAERVRCNTIFSPMVVHYPSSSEQVAQHSAQNLLQQQTEPLQQGLLDVVGVNLTSNSLPFMSENSIQSSAFGGDGTIAGHNMIAPHHHLTSPSSQIQLMQLPQMMGPMQGGDATLYLAQSTPSVPFTGVNSIQALTCGEDRTIGTVQNIVAPRHHFVEASAAAQPFESYSRTLLEERIGHPFFSGLPSLAPPGLGVSCGPFSSSAGSNSEMSVFSRLEPHRSAKPSAILDPSTVCSVQPGYCNSSDDDFCKLDSLEAAWAARKK